MMNVLGVCRHGLGGDMFSTGMDRLAAELNRQTPAGCHFTASGGNDPRLDGDSFDAGLLAAAQKGATLVLAGHSLGADEVLRLCDKARVAGIRLPLVCPIDPVCWDGDAQQWSAGRWEVGDNVDLVVGYLSTSFPGGGRVFCAPGNKTTIVSDTQLDLPHAAMPGGLDIASSPVVHAAIVAAVRALVVKLQGT